MLSNLAKERKSNMRTLAVPITEVPGALPEASIADDVDQAPAVTSCLKHLTSPSAKHFTEDVLWRDLFALTGTLRTISGSDCVEAAWKELSNQHDSFGFNLIPETSRVVRFGPKVCWIQAMFSFENRRGPAAKCSGIIGIVPGENGDWKIWMLSTILELVVGWPNVDVLEPKTTDGVMNRDMTLHKTNGANEYILPKLREKSVNHQCRPILKLSRFDCVIVGAGMAGLSTAGRLKSLGVSSVTLERNPRIGDNWMLRYDTVRRRLYSIQIESITDDCSPHSKGVW
jgi:hypothetical protein